MPHKHPNTERWGGPGASHEDRTEPKPKAAKQRVRDLTKVHSHVSGGGGEPDAVATKASRRPSGEMFAG